MRKSNRAIALKKYQTTMKEIRTPCLRSRQCLNFSLDLPEEFVQRVVTTVRGDAWASGLDLSLLANPRI